MAAKYKRGCHFIFFSRSDSAALKVHDGSLSNLTFSNPTIYLRYYSLAFLGPMEYNNVSHSNITAGVQQQTQIPCKLTKLSRHSNHIHSTKGTNTSENKAVHALRVLARLKMRYPTHL